MESDVRVNPFHEAIKIKTMPQSVLVVGAGPVGLLAAAEIKRYGVGVDIIDSRLARDTKSKALSVSAATLKTLSGIGVNLELSPKAARVYDITILFNNRRIAHINKRYIRSRFDFYLSIPQPETERLLELHLAQMQVEVSRGLSITDIVQCGEGVEVEIHNLQTDSKCRKTYSAVVGCDGSQSTVRQLIGIPFTGVDYNAHMVLADVHFETTAEQQHESSYHVAEDGFLVFLPMGDGVTRLVIGKTGLRSRDASPPGLPPLGGPVQI